MTEAEIDQKIVDIEATTLDVLREANGGSTSTAAINYAKRRIAEGAASKQLVGAGKCGSGCGCH